LIITDSEDRRVIKISPEEQNSLLGVTQEGVELLVMLILPVFILVESFKTLLDVVDH